MTGIKFRRNNKVNLLDAKAGEIVFAIDTNEWGLGLTNGSMSWRNHEILFKNLYLQGQGIPAPLLGDIGMYYFDLTNLIVYQKQEAGWLEIDYPISQTIYDTMYLAKDSAPDYANDSTIIKKDGTVKAQAGYVPTDPQDAMTKGEAEATFGVLQPDGSTQMIDGYVATGDHVMTLNDTNLPQNIILPTIEPTEGGILWNNNGVPTITPIPLQEVTPLPEQGLIKYTAIDPATGIEISNANSDSEYSYAVEDDGAGNLIWVDVASAGVDYYGNDTQNTQIATPNGYLYIATTISDSVTDYYYSAEGSNQQAWRTVGVVYDMNISALEIIKWGQRKNYHGIAYGANNLTEVIISATDTCLATNFEWAFTYTSLTTFPTFDSGTVKTLHWTFGDCYLLTEIPDLDYSGVQNFSNTWDSNYLITSVPATMNTSAGVDFTATWANCEFTTFPLLDMSNAEQLGSTWAGCWKMTTFPAINFPLGKFYYKTWANTSAMTTFPVINLGSPAKLDRTWWYGAIVDFPLIDVSTVTEFIFTWYQSGLQTIAQLDYSGATFLQGLWKNCASLQHVPAMNTSSAVTWHYVFENCTSLVCIGGLDTTVADPTYMYLFDDATSGRMFYNTPALVQPDSSGFDEIKTRTIWTSPTACP